MGEREREGERAVDGESMKTRRRKTSLSDECIDFGLVKVRIRVRITVRFRIRVRVRVTVRVRVRILTVAVPKVAMVTVAAKGLDNTTTRKGLGKAWGGGGPYIGGV